MAARMEAFRVSLCLAAAVVLTACGGGGGGSSSSVLPATSAPGGNGPSSAPASVAISIAIPPASAASAARRRARYISDATKSIAVTFSGSRQTADCTTMCNLTLTVVPGTITFTVSLYDAAGGVGNLLSTGTTTAAIAQGQQNTVAITFGGVVAKVGISLGTTTVTAGSAATIPVTVTAQDAAGYTIVGSDPYATAIALADDDRSGATTLSASSVGAPGAPVTLSYNGSANIAAVHLSASVPGAALASPTVTLNVQSPPVPTPPPGNVPLHETTWYYYGLNGTNASIPASWMAAHADFVEDDGNSAQHAEAFKDAGGKYAVSYTDPAYVPYCPAPYAPPNAGQCRGQVGALTTTESAWFHAADGTRVRRFVSDYFQSQEALNPAAQAARDAWHQATLNLLASAPKLDYFFADDSGGIFIGDDGTQMSGWMYGFTAPAVEITTDAAFLAAERPYLAAAARPVIINGIDPRNAMPSYNGTLLDAPNVAGQNFEGCFSDGSGVGGDARNNWQHMANGLLAAIAHRSNAVCMMMASATPANRIYNLASWWMTYSESYSVAAPMNPTADGFTVVPEFEIVPRGPRATAMSDVAVLRTPGGAYVREFGACYQAGAPIGPCAAVVNTTASSVALPALAGHYANALTVDDKSAYTGGKATWTGAVPAQLAASSAVVLR